MAIVISYNSYIYSKNSDYKILASKRIELQQVASTISSKVMLFNQTVFCYKEIIDGKLTTPEMKKNGYFQYIEDLLVPSIIKRINIKTIEEIEDFFTEIALLNLKVNNNYQKALINLRKRATLKNIKKANIICLPS